MKPATKPYVFMVNARAVTRPGEIVGFTLVGSGLSGALLWVFGMFDLSLIVGVMIGGLNAAVIVRNNARRS